VDHELDASQHASEEHIHEAKDSHGSHIAWFLSFLKVAMFCSKNGAFASTPTPLSNVRTNTLSSAHVFLSLLHCCLLRGGEHLLLPKMYSNVVKPRP
jgi:hypothetical protein